MTIFTKTVSDEEKKENEAKLKKPDGVVYVDPEVTAESPRLSRPSVAWSNDVPLDWYLQMRRRRLMTSLCAILLVLWLLMAAIIGGILLFRYLHRRPTYYGWCGVKYVDEVGHPERLEQRVEIDPNNDYEKIEVPRFGANRPAVFVHDFRQNLTGIVDVAGDQCFIKRLDRRNVAPPTSFIDLVKKMESGYYEQNTQVIRESYRVGHVLSSDQLDKLGSWMIRLQCHHRVSYMLERSSHALERPVPTIQNDRLKRSISELESCKTFSAFDGHSVDEIKIC